MFHECKVYCHAIPEEHAKALGMDNPVGKWLPFTIYLGCINAFKMSTDEDEDGTQYCTTVYTDTGDIYILDTLYKEFNTIWKKFMVDEYFPNDEPSSDGDLEL
jgi:hypothetical protein